ncbi:hypothetical protein ACLB2K_019926 [Fragaria x ananassa]
MASPQQVAPSADVVGNAFVLQYYHILEKSPEHVYRFYQDDSKFGRPEGNGMMNTVTTMDIINRKIVENGMLSANVVTVDAQESFNRGVFVLVTGFIIGMDNLKKKFTQSFFLAPQDKGGFYVLNDVFRYVDDSVNQDTDHGSVADVEAPLNSEQEPSLPDSHASPIMINGRQVVVEEKRSTSQGGSRGRFSSGRGTGYRNEGSNGYRNEGPNGYRNEGPNGYRKDGPTAGCRNDAPNGYRGDGPRGRGGYGGGRGYGRSDFKSEFGGRNTGRGGSSGRGGDGFQRSENGGRVNRAGGPTVNAAPKTSAPRVSASA